MVTVAQGLLGVGGRCRNPHRNQKALLPFKNRLGRVACHQRPRTAHL